MGWEPGEQILWCYRGDIRPVTMISDGDDGLAVWLAGGTGMLRDVPADGRDLREIPLDERFRAPRVLALVAWQGPGIVMLERPGRAHSLWLFRKWGKPTDPDGWYANLEAPLRRSDRGVHSLDHVLDVWRSVDGDVHFKDEDEVVAAIAAGRFTAEAAAEHRAEGERVFAEMLAGGPPFEGPWLDWQPDPAWPLPTLPDDLRALVGRPMKRGQTVADLVGIVPGPPLPPR